MGHIFTNDLSLHNLLIRAREWGNVGDNLCND